MVELVFDTGGRDVELKSLAVRAANDTSGAMRLGFARTDGLPVRACAGGPVTFRFDSMDHDGRELSDSAIVDAIRAAVRDGVLYADAAVISTGEHAPDMSLLAVNVMDEASGEASATIDLTGGPLPVRPLTARMTVCLSDADEVRAAMRSVLRSALLDEKCSSFVSADAVSRFLTDALMESGAWMDVAYPSLGRDTARYDELPYVLERHPGKDACSFYFVRTPCSVESLVAGILKDPSCPKGKIRIHNRTGSEVSLDYDGARVLRQAGPFGHMKNAFVSPNGVSVVDDAGGMFSCWDVRLD